MENAYGIGVKNRYDLFYNEELDPFEIIQQQEIEKQRRKTEKGTVKEKAKTITKQGKPAPAQGPVKKGKESTSPPNPKSTEVTEAPNKPGGRPFRDRISKVASDDVKDNEERKNFRNREDQHSGVEQSSNFTRNTAVKRGNQERERGDGEFRRGRGGFRGRGGRGGRGRGGFSNFEGRKRDFDRHSGSDKTGIRHVDKREGAGTGNWGTVKDFCPAPPERREESGTWDEPREEFDRSEKKEPATDEIWGEVNHELEVETDKPAVPETTEPAGDEATAENTESKENVPVVDEETVEEAAREMTLDEWKREQEAKRAVPKFNLRKPGEGEDGSQWKKLYMLKKKAKEDDDDEEDEDEEDVDDEEFGRRGRHRQLIDIQINFNDSRRGRGGRGRGGRGAGPRTGGNPRDGPREERNRDAGGPSSTPGERGSRMNRGPPKMKTPQQSAPRVDDWNDFPSLVTA